MRIKIVHKIFAALTLTTLVAIVLVTLVAQWSVQDGFRNYLWQGEMQRLQTQLEPLQRHYRQVGNWSVIEADPFLLGQLLAQGSSGPTDRSGDRRNIPDGESGRRLRNDRPPPPENGFRRPPGSGNNDDMRPRPMHPPRDGNPLHRISLLDGQKRLVIGKPRPEAWLIKLQVDDKLVGYLALSPPPFIAPAEVSFVQRQLQVLVAAGLGALVLAILVALLLSRHLVAPILAVARALRQTATGDFETQAQVKVNDEVGQLANDFNHLAASLRKNEILRRQMTADIAHELRTPLAILRGEIEAVLDGIRPLNIVTMQSLQEEALRLDRLVNDLHTLAMSDCGALNYSMQAIQLDDLVQTVAAQFELRAAKAGLQIHSDTEPLQVMGDSARLMQLLGNLLENSLRYTDSPGSVHINLKRLGNSAVLQIEDSSPCPGITAIPHLFERFYRPDLERSSSKGGSGLGLAICKNIADAHKASLHAEASDLGGLRITLQLPISGTQHG